MIKPYPGGLPTPPEQQPPEPSRLRLMLKNGPELIDVVNGFIKKFSLQYEVIIGEDGNGILKSILSRGEQHLEKFITREPETLEMKQHASLMAKTPYEVLVCGESGTGKEILAQSMIADRRGEIKAVNCAGFPETLIESELFGYKRGSFTGAEADRDGLITSAGDGVMFLDEIGEMPLVMQAKLLRVIQEKRLRKVGSTKAEDITCKFVFATNQDLQEMVKKGIFRKDLYARISTLELSIKPIRDRECDIKPITESLPNGKAFLEKYESQLMNGALDLSLNVRSIQQHVTRFNVLGKVIYKK